MNSVSKFLKQQHLTSLAVLLLLLLLLIVGAVPGYLSGRWPWQQPLPVPTLKELKQIRHQGLNLPGWQTVEQVEQPIGEHKWSVQIIKQEAAKNPVILLLFPQNGPKDQPEIEWIDVAGWGKLRWGRWDVAQESSAQLSVKQPGNSGKHGTIQIEATFFRVATNQDTFAVLQWYALPNTGYTSPFRWFVTDQLAQLQKRRTPWVAVSIMIPIEPLGNVETTWPLAQSIGEAVQSTLMAEALKIS
jgi:cyanoexosortase B-associated protein